METRRVSYACILRENDCADLLLHPPNLLLLGCSILLQLHLASFMLFSVLCEPSELERHRRIPHLMLTLAAFSSLDNDSSCL